jgi:very-short-patch-repair endonuclease
VRVGGVATGVTAAAALGLWVPPDDRLAVAVPATASRLRSPDDPARPLSPSDRVRVHWAARPFPPSVSGTRIAPPLLVFEHVLLTQQPAQAIAVLDSALHERRVRLADLALLRECLPAHLAALVRHVDGRCESGIESIARFLLQLAGLDVAVQVRIDGIGRVDLLVEGRLIVELDGRETHEGSFEVDRHRDAVAARLGHRTLRFSYRKVMYQWPEVLATVLAALAA